MSTLVTMQPLLVASAFRTQFASRNFYHSSDALDMQLCVTG